jgi:CDP-diacylglycerol--glycerol-3-phosphate 3-phosphatidyltransferase
MAAVDFLILIAGFVLACHYRGLQQAGLWAFKVSVVMLYQQLFLLRHRKRILSGENLDHLWGVANILSLSRGLMLALLAGFLFAPKPTGAASWLPAILYTFLAGLDFLDGYWARKTRTQTRLGELLDQEYDALGILIAVLLVIRYGHLPAAFLYVGLAKYAFAWAVTWRRLRGAEVHPLPPSYMRRRLAGFQMGILAVFLWPMARPPGTVLAELIIGVPLLLGFVRDWLLVSGTLDPQHPGYERTRKIFYRVGGTLVSLIARTVLLAAAVMMLVTVFRHGALPAGWLPQGVLPARLLMTVYAALRLLLLLLLIAGRFTSASALMLLLLEGLRIFLGGLDPWGAAIVTAALLLYLFGAGPYRLVLRRPAQAASDPAERLRT